jgi:3-methyl-2-oxobutanoate hydroxymethyltransferase
MRVTTAALQRMKLERQRIVAMTAYDYEMARIIERAGVDIILVGDSGAQYLLGYDDMNAVTMDEMVLLTRSVSRGAKRAMVIGDLPFMTYQVNKDEAVRNAGRMIQQAGAQAVKLECGADYAPTVEAIVKAGIPVMAHMGITPQVAIGLGGFRSQDARIDEEKTWRDARALEAAGSFSLLLTGIPPDLARRITAEVKVPTIAGLGAGDACDGQIGVTHPLVGLSADDLDHRQSAYGPVAASLLEAAQKFTADVRAGKNVRIG